MDVWLRLLRLRSHDHGWSGRSSADILLSLAGHCRNDAYVPIYVRRDHWPTVLHDTSGNTCFSTARQDCSAGSDGEHCDNVRQTLAISLPPRGHTNVSYSFVVSFTLPYLLDTPGANLQSKVGFIYGSICFVAMAWGYFFLPELKGRSLEELEELFAAKLPLRKFRNYQANEDGVGAAVSRLERLQGEDPTIAKLQVHAGEDKA